MDIPIWVWAINIIGVAVIVWFLSWRLKSKLAEVEDRHVMSGIRPVSYTHLTLPTSDIV